MLKPNSLGKNTTFLMGGALIQKFLSLIAGILIVRFLGPEKYGQFTFIVTLVTFACIFIDFGMNTFITKLVATEKTYKNKYIASALIFKICIVIPIFLLTFSIVHFIQKSYSQILPFTIFYLSYFINNISGQLQAVFIGMQRMEFSAFIDLIKGIILTTFLVLIIFYKNNGLSIEHIFLCYFVSMLSAFLVLLVIYNKKFGFNNFSYDYSAVLRIIKGSSSLFLISVVNILLFRIDHLMLSAISGDRQLGIYSSAYTIFEVLISFFPNLIITAIFPILSKYYQNNNYKFNYFNNVIIKYFIVISVPMSFGILIISDDLINLLYGEAYQDATIVMWVLGCSIWVFFLSYIISWSLTAANSQIIVLKANLLALIINIVLNYFFIYRYGAVGAGTVTVISEFISLLYMFFYGRKIIKIIFIKNFIFTTIFSFIMTIALIFFGNKLSGLDLLSRIIVNVVFSIIIYTFLIYFFKLVKLKELKIMLFYK